MKKLILTIQSLIVLIFMVFTTNIVMGQSSFSVSNSNNDTLLFVDSTGTVGIGVTNPTEKLEVNGNIIAADPTQSNHVATKNYVDSAGGSGGNVPQGGIIMWSGSIASIPADWALCDGTNGTPDLRDKFVVGAGSAYNVGDAGGRISTH